MVASSPNAIAMRDASSTLAAPASGYVLGRSSTAECAGIKLSGGLNGKGSQWISARKTIGFDNRTVYRPPPRCKRAGGTFDVPSGDPEFLICDTAVSTSPPTGRGVVFMKCSASSTTRCSGGDWYTPLLDADPRPALATRCPGKRARPQWLPLMGPRRAGRTAPRSSIRRTALCLLNSCVWEPASGGDSMRAAIARKAHLAIAVRSSRMNAGGRVLPPCSQQALGCADCRRDTSADVVASLGRLHRYESPTRSSAPERT